jgi:hypothetical protein
MCFVTAPRLRFDFEKGEIELIVKKIWALKLAAEEYRADQGLGPQLLDEFFYDYICYRFQDITAIMEFSYVYVVASVSLSEEAKVGC